MRGYKALIAHRPEAGVCARSSVIFFNYLFPLIFFFIFGQAMHAERGAAMTIVIAMVLIIGILGNGLFGAGIRAVQDREANILRRYKVTPITPAPLLIASVVTGWILYMPNVILIFTLSHYLYGMPWPQSMGSILIFVTVAIVGFRAIGLILASVVNSMQESQLLVQLVYLPMLFLSGATFPLAMFPPWLLVITQFVPATYMVIGIQGMLLRNEGIAAEYSAHARAHAYRLCRLVHLLQTFPLGKRRKNSRLRQAVAGGGFDAISGAWRFWQMHARTGIAKTKILNRQLARGDTFLIRGARIFVGDGKVIENGAVLVRGGKIAEVYEGEAPDPKTLKAETVEAAGKTILPGLIDVHIHLGAPGGFYPDMSKYDAEKSMKRNLAAYLYSGVTTVRSVGDGLDAALRVRAAANTGEMLGADFYTCGPMFTAPGGHGTEYLQGSSPVRPLQSGKANRSHSRFQRRSAATGRRIENARRRLHQGNS